MAFVLDQATMRKTFEIKDDKASITHNTKLFRLFPYTTSGRIVDSFDSVIGEYIRIFLSKKAVEMDSLGLKEAIQKELNINEEDLAVFNDAISSVFFQDGILRPMNLRMFSYISCSNIADRHMAHFLAGVLGASR